MKPSLPLKLIPRTPAELEQSLVETLSKRSDHSAGIWLFVYGLLAKEPPFVYVSCHPTKLEGWQRCFHLADPMNRGTADKPGVTLGLEAGGFCEGIAYLLSDVEMKEGLMAVWNQEMLLPFYQPAWVMIEGQEMLVMLTDLESPALWLTATLQETAGVIAKSHGKTGTNKDYLQDVRLAFSSVGAIDEYLEKLADMLKG